MRIVKLKQDEEMPYELLLQADETIEAIQSYLHSSEVYVLMNHVSQPIAVFVLHENSKDELEIKNIAVVEEGRGKGIGSLLIKNIRNIARAGGYCRLLVGTPDTDNILINFYKKNGFSPYQIRKNFFIENYAEPIFENGKLLKDMLVLKMAV